MSKFSKELFKNPTKEYRGAPFWAWNGKLNKSVIKEQIDTFKKMGFGGFHIHSRIGLNTPYMQDEFMDCVKYCNDYAKQNDMFTYLYDEDKWPSGYGGGAVTQNVEFRARYLLFSPTLYENGHLDRKRPPKGRLTENGTVTLLAKYTVELENGRLKTYRLLDIDSPENENTWYAYEVVGDKLPWFNNEAYVDVLNPDAIKKFTEITHEKYKSCIGDEFGKTVPSIFTDEPQFIKMQQLDDGEELGEASLAYTTDFETSFKEAYGYSFFEKLPELLWEKADGSLSTMKYHYYNFLSDRFADSYSKTLGSWCSKNNIKLTGHLMQEDTLESQSQCVGDAMRSYPHFGIPGIDLLAGIPQYNAAKQVQSVAHQYGKKDALSELYGVTNWDYDFRHHKLQGDWHAALGITLRVPHLSWMYMGGESKRDYPAPIDAHSPWYEKYPLIENHFARVNTVIKRGKPDVKACVLHPVESYWMLIGSQKQTMMKRTEMNDSFEELTNLLLFNLIDFDFISEGLMPTQNVKAENGKLTVGEMEYEVVIIPKLLTIRKTTLDILDMFQKSGGKIIMLGDAPKYVDGKLSSLAERINAKPIGFDKNALLYELEPYRDLDIKNSLGLRHDSLIYQLRSENDEKWLFVAHGKEEENIEFGVFQRRSTSNMEFSLKGTYAAELLDTISGDIAAINVVHKNGKTVFNLPCYEHDSFLLHFTKNTMQKGIEKTEKSELLHEFYLDSPQSYELEEPNCLLLDQAYWRLNDGEWQPKEEILKIDDKVRKTLNMSLRTDSFPQPWISKEENIKNDVLELRFEILSDATLSDIALAFEGDSDVTINLNGKDVLWEKGEYYIDRAINKVHLGKIVKGENVLILKMPFGEKTNPEWCYLLGKFGVKLTGKDALLTSKPEKIGYGDYSTQGLSFYGGNLIYEAMVETDEGFLHGAD